MTTPITCRACRYRWTPRKAKHCPRYRCPTCFRLVRPAEGKKYLLTAAAAKG